MNNVTYNSPCVDVNGNPQPGFSDPTQCAAAGFVSNDPAVNPYRHLEIGSRTL